MGRVSDAKDRLLASGSELIHERGYTAVGVSELCSAAGVKKGSFYHFFPSKLELAMEVVDGFSRQTEGIFEALTRSEVPPLQRLADYAASVHQHHSDTRQACGKVLGCPIGNLALEMSTREPELRERLQKVFHHNVACFEQVVQDAVDRQDIPPLDVSRAAVSILAIVEGSVMLAKMRDDTEILQGLASDIYRLIGAERESVNQS